MNLAYHFMMAIAFHDIMPEQKRVQADGALNPKRRGQL
jgi:hypothetical protein